MKIARPPIGMRVWLMALAILASLPLFLFAAYLLREIGSTQRDAVTALLSQHAGAVAAAVDQRLDFSLGALTALANSDAALENDLPALYAHARRIVTTRPDIQAISLVAPDNGIVFITLRPLGTQGLRAGDPAVVGRVFATGRPAVSGPFKSPISDRVVTSLGIPVVRHGKVVYCLRAVFLASSLSELLTEQKPPPGWTSRIITGNGLVVARSPENYIGSLASPAMLAALRAGTRSVFDIVTREGVPSQAVMVEVPGWDWRVVVSVPTATLHAGLERSLTLLVLFGLATVVVCTAAALWLSRLITRHMQGLLAVSMALHRGETPATGRLPIREMDALARAMDEAARREQRTNLALSNVTAQHRQVASELASARHDALTGLPTRALFLELTENLRSTVAAHGGGRLALLFIDLDGFKAVNDHYGHDEGDRVLARTAEILRALTRQSDVAGRLGGDEFVICLATAEELILATAREVAERILERVGGIGLGIGCSIGIAIWADRCPDLSCALRRADEAMYEAKQRGKNRYAIFGFEAKAEGSPWQASVPATCEVRCPVKYTTAIPRP